MEDLKPHRNAGRSRLVLGLFLLALGGLMLAVNLGYQMPIGWWRYFPVPLMALGVLGLVLPTRHLDRSGGIWLFAIGLYCLVGVFGMNRPRQVMVFRNLVASGATWEEALERATVR